HYAYVAGLDGEGFEFHLGSRSFAGVFPTNNGEANVWVCGPAADAEAAIDATPDRTAAFTALLADASPSLAARVGRPRPTAPARGAMRLPNQVRQAGGPGWALVGDAGYHRDPITGHGITDAFRDAELLTRHLHPALEGSNSEKAALEAYATERNEALFPICDVTCRLGEFPPADDFIFLQKTLSDLIDAEAKWAAALPPVGSPP